MKSPASRIIGKIKRGFKKPFKVIWFRATQEGTLFAMGKLGAWPKLAAKVGRHFDSESIEQIQGKLPRVLIPSGALDEVKKLPGVAGILAKADKLLAAEIEIFGSQVKQPIDWHTDWLHARRWEPQYFWVYDFDEPKTIPYDIRRVWELSRLIFVPQLLQASALTGDNKYAEKAFGYLKDWDDQNPMAYSVNWHPMECSMRIFYLLLSLELCEEGGIGNAEEISMLLRSIATHAEFLWRTIEYSDVRGNHYSSNLMALALAGLKLSPVFPAAKGWADYAEREIAREIPLQYLNDGVNMEKSIPYHRLNTEMFLVSLLALESAGRKPLPQSTELMRKACLFSAAYQRPDGLAPVWADNDNAKLSVLDPVETRDHRGLLALGALIHKDGRMKDAAGELHPFAVWIYGKGASSTWQSIQPEKPKELENFPDGGFAIARIQDQYLLADVGEIGFKGRGGHGHLDLFSFEYCAEGLPLIIDPGCYVYSGDHEAKKVFRSGVYHNILLIDDQDLCSSATLWDIYDPVFPTGSSANQKGKTITVKGSHRGFKEDGEPVEHMRVLTLDEKGFQCQDSLKCKAAHTVKRWLHFDAPVEVGLKANKATATINTKRFQIQWDSQSTAELEDGWVSYSYGERREAKILKLTTKIAGPSEFEFTVRKL